MHSADFHANPWLSLQDLEDNAPAKKTGANNVAGARYASTSNEAGSHPGVDWTSGGMLGPQIKNYMQVRQTSHCALAEFRLFIYHCSPELVYSCCGMKSKKVPPRDY